MGVECAYDDEDVEKTQSTKPRLVTYVAGAIVAVAPVGWVFVTWRSRRD